MINLLALRCLTGKSLYLKKFNYKELVLGDSY